MAGMIVDAAAEIMCRPWKWGEADCFTAAGDLFLHLWGVDPVATLRGAYASRREAVAILRARGGLSETLRQAAEAAGLSAGTGAAGEIGVISWRGRAVTAVRVQPGLWVGKSFEGMALAPGEGRGWRA